MSTASTTSGDLKARAQLEKDRVQRHAKQVKSGLTPLKIYLLAYNVLSALLWLHLLVVTTTFIFAPRSTSIQASASSGSTNFFTRLISSITSTTNTVGTFSHNLPKPIVQVIDHLSGSYNYKNLGWWTKWTQTLAVLEVVHAGLGWVRSPLGTVMSQVASRVWTVWGVVEAVPDVSHSSPLFATMLFAWSLTEVIRYTFYSLSLLSISLPLLNYLRYTTFIPLYPLGAGSEAFLSFSTLPPFSTLFSDLIGRLPLKWKSKAMKSSWGRAVLWKAAKGGMMRSTASSAASGRNWGWMELVRLGLFVIWWPALYVLYTYMLKQRRKVLGKGKTVGGVNKAR
ncbi:hypothetical protein IAR55_004756 [Kwoniella newhampshirensis]|uniref:Very-long-chain (3R)-3-hydroxyacyl-CoA dehydratase n=1 Tax=Kwoniella newhampshirensis TaxID=1651941 RepID=A0AAW0YMT5_9TREE